MRIIPLHYVEVTEEAALAVAGADAREGHWTDLSLAVVAAVEVVNL